MHLLFNSQRNFTHSEFKLSPSHKKWYIANCTRQCPQKPRYHLLSRHRFRSRDKLNGSRVIIVKLDAPSRSQTTLHSGAGLYSILRTSWHLSSRLIREEGVLATIRNGWRRVLLLQWLLLVGDVRGRPHSQLGLLPVFLSGESSRSRRCHYDQHPNHLRGRFGMHFL